MPGPQISDAELAAINAVSGPLPARQRRLDWALPARPASNVR